MPFIVLVSLHFREAPFRAANAAASVASKSAQIYKRLARVKFVNLVLPKLPFKLGFVGTGRAGVITNHAVNVEDAPVAAASERLCAFKHLLGSAPFSEAISS